MCSKSQIRNPFFYTCSVQNDLKKGHASPPLLFNSVLECAITKIPENYCGLRMNWDITFWLTIVIWTYWVIKKNTNALLIAIEKVGLEVNAEKTVYAHLSHQQNAGNNYSLKTDKKSSENIAKSTYFIFSLTNQK